MVMYPIRCIIYQAIHNIKPLPSGVGVDLDRLILQVAGSFRDVIMFSALRWEV